MKPEIRKPTEQEKKMYRMRGRLFALLLLVGGTGCAERRTGPWNLKTLYQTPSMEWVDSSGPVRSLYYAGEPFQGHATRVFAYYAAPKDCKGKVPAMVLVHGGGGKAFPEWAELWAKRGYAAIAMDLAGNGPDGKHLPDGGPNQREEDKFDAIARGVKEAWTYHAVAAIIRAHSLLRSFPEVDDNRTGITGISWGGYLTCIVSGLDDRFKVSVPVYGCGFLHEDSAWTGRMDQMLQADRQAWIDNYDPMQYLPGCRIPILFVNGTNDFAYPLDSYQKCYRLVRGPRTLCITVKMPHGHVEGWTPKEIGIFVDSVLTDGTPLARITRTARQGNKVAVNYTSAVPIREAALHYTKDKGQWQTREWQTIPAQLQENTANAELPATSGITYFLTIKDDRGAVVSTEHETLE